MSDLTSFIKALQHPVLVTNSAGRIIDSNSSATILTGSGPDQLKKADIFSVIPGLKDEVHNLPDKDSFSVEGIHFLDTNGAKKAKVRIFINRLVLDNETFYCFNLEEIREDRIGDKIGDGVEEKTVQRAEVKGVSINLAPPYDTDINTQNELQTASENIRLLTESILDVITWLDHRGNVLYQSPSLKEMLGYDPEKFRNINEVNALIHPDDIRNFKVTRQRNTLEKANNYSITYRLKNKKGEYRWIESNIRNLFDEKGALKNVIFTSRDITDRKQAESQLKKSQLMYQYLADNSNDVIIRLDSSNRITYISPSCKQLLGYHHKEILAEESFLPFLFPEDREKFEKIWQESLEKRELFLERRIRLHHKDNYPVWVEVLIRREYDNKGNLIQSIANIRNISERINYQLELEKIKERYQLAVEAGHTGIWDYSFEDDRLIVDDSLKNLLGYKDDTDMGDGYFWENLVYEKDRDSLRNAIDQNILNHRAYFEETFRLRHRHRVLLWVLGRGKIFYKNGNATRIVCSVTDITDRRESSEQLRKTLINFKAIFDAFPDLFFRVNKLGDFLEVMAGESNAFSTGNIMTFEGKNMKDAFPESEYLKIYDCLQRSYESRKVESCHYDLEIDKEKKHYEARIIAISSKEAIGIVRDITQAVKTNQELIEAKKTAEEALNAKDEFLSMMSHEIRTPLNVVIGMVYLLLEQDPRPEQLKFINTLKFSSDNLLRLINDLLDFSKIRAGKIVFEETDFNLREFIINIYESYKLQLDSSRVKVELDMEDDLPVLVRGDFNRLAQILSNLLSNAQKFTEKGKITIKVRAGKAGKEKSEIHFAIHDTGIGISEEKLSAIFEPFEQESADTSRKYGGTGLGLSIVKQLVELQDGEISVKSEPGKGSAFMVTLPMKRVEEKDSWKEQVRHEDLKPSKEGGIRMLYADDVSSNQFLMKGFADLWKFHLDLASNGQQTLDLFSENTYDVILLDLQMPVIDGFETARRIREIEASIGVYTPILAVTGDISDSALSRITEAGMDDYITKPVNPNIMLKKINELIRDKPGRKEYAGLSPEAGPEASRNNTGAEEQPVSDFEQLDALYDGVPDQYTSYLNALRNEFTENKQLIIEALKNENFDEFRRIRHSMISNMKILKMTRLQYLLDEIKDKFTASELPPLGGDYGERVQRLMEQIVANLENKKRMITS